MPVYTLVVAPGGFKLKPSDQKNDPAPGSVRCPADDRACAILYVGSIQLADFAGDLGAMVGRPVIDKTGLTGTYSMNLTWPGRYRQPRFVLSLIALLRCQINSGSELKSEKASVDAPVIDHLESPRKSICLADNSLRNLLSRSFEVLLHFCGYGFTEAGHAAARRNNTHRKVSARSVRRPSPVSSDSSFTIIF